MQYSISNWIYATEDLEKSLQRLAKYKYDAVELEGEPDKEKYKPKKVITKRIGLEELSTIFKDVSVFRNNLKIVINFESK